MNYDSSAAIPKFLVAAATASVVVAFAGYGWWPILGVAAGGVIVLAFVAGLPRAGRSKHA